MEALVIRLDAERVEQLPAPLGRAVIDEAGLRGLSCGCGTRLQDGWLNSDIAQYVAQNGSATSPGRVALVQDCHYLQHDATMPFPIEDEAFDWVHSEHFIEHINPAQGIAWLGDMHRLLKPGGHIRISTPDLGKYVEGYSDPEGEFFAEHRRRLDPMLAGLLNPPRKNPQHLGQAYFEGGSEVPSRRAFIFNQIFLLPVWGHKWIYDLDELRHAATRAGFSPEEVVEAGYQIGRAPEVLALDAPVHSDESVYVELIKR